MVAQFLKLSIMRVPGILTGAFAAAAAIGCNEASDVCGGKFDMGPALDRCLGGDGGSDADADGAIADGGLRPDGGVSDAGVVQQDALVDAAAHDASVDETLECGFSRTGVICLVTECTFEDLKRCLGTLCDECPDDPACAVTTDSFMPSDLCLT